MSRERDHGSRGEDFASRWSRRKRAAQAAPAEARGEAAETDAGAEKPDTRSDAEILAELGLPDPDTLKPGDDVRGFMAAAVPARLRNRALRKLWVSNPVFANLDQLVDYGDDFTDAAMVPQILNTAYRVGRGWLEPEEETAARDGGAPGGVGEGPAGAAQPEPPADPDAAEDSTDSEESLRETPAGPPPGTEAPAEPVAWTAPDTRRPARRRRMRFRFADE